MTKLKSAADVVNNFQWFEVDEVPRPCATCGTVTNFKFKALKFCDACIENERDQQREKERNKRWEEICSPLFRMTEESKLPFKSQACLGEMMKWENGPRGLILIGQTGVGKSRCAWLLLKREFWSGRSVIAVDSTFGFQYALKFSDSATSVSDWMGRIMRCDLLLMDDVLKAKLTDSVEQALFAIVNHRMEHLLPMIITTNDTGESLKNRMSQDRGDAMIRRLREFNDSIVF